MDDTQRELVGRALYEACRMDDYPFSRVDLCVREPEKRMEGARMKEYPGG
jgi:hypothetical protein